MARSVMSAKPPSDILAFVHPGRPLMDRMSYIDIAVAPTLRLRVEAGQDLYQIIHDELDRSQSKACAFTLIGGTVASLTIMTGGAGDKGLPIGFHGPHPIPGSFTVLAGAGSTGTDLQGKHLTHCHAAFRGADGVMVGGHLMLGKTIAGPEGITIDMTVVCRGHFVRRTDDETLFDIFHPEAQ